MIHSKIFQDTLPPTSAALRPGSPLKGSRRRRLEPPSRHRQLKEQAQGLNDLVHTVLGEWADRN